jgi:small subunit ribosomal protein S16
VGYKRSRYWYFVVQPQKKKLQGVALERLGVWFHKPNRKTVPRQVSLNIHRAKYWLSVGAEPSRQVHRLFSKFGLLPQLPPKYGSVHHYDKPERDY